MGLDGYLLSCLTCGMSPVISIMEATQQVKWATNYAYKADTIHVLNSQWCTSPGSSDEHFPGHFAGVPG